MNTIVFSASPKKEGYTNKLLNLVLREVDNYEIYYPYKMNIKPCIDCGWCREHPSCFIKDDMQKIYNDIYGASNIIIAAPVYFGGFPSPMKMIIDRCQNFYFNPVSKEKKVFLLSTCGRKKEDMEKAMVIETEYLMKAINGKLIESIIVRDTDNNKFDVDCDKIKGIINIINNSKTGE